MRRRLAAKSSSCGRKFFLYPAGWVPIFEDLPVYETRPCYTTSFQDTPGSHHPLLESQGYEIVNAEGRCRGQNAGSLSATSTRILCGDDAYTRTVGWKNACLG